MDEIIAFLSTGNLELVLSRPTHGDVAAESNLLIPMSDLLERLPQNTMGAYYVDATCIDCDQCRATAPAFFRRDDEIGQSVVYRQPINDEEIELATEALEGCPTESIGSDGDSE